MGYLDLKPKLTPESIAKEIIKKYHINKFPVNLQLLLKELNIFYAEDLLNKTEEGCSFKEDKKFGIIISTRIKHKQRKYFTLAHELGHILLNHLKDINCIMCNLEDIETFQVNKEKEFEANRFASELLLPSVELMKQIKKNNISIDLVKTISNTYGTSFTSTAIKIVKISDLPCILIMSKNKKIEWYVSSPDIKYKYEIPLSRLPENTYAMDLFENSFDNTIEGEIEANEWLEDGDDLVDKLGTIYEQSIYYPGYNRVLTLLILPDVSFGEMSF